MPLININYSGDSKVIKRLCEAINRLGRVALIDTGDDTTKFLRNDGAWTTISTSASVSLNYGICSTAAATAAKVVTVASFTLEIGASVIVKFTNAVPASATLNVNSTGAKAIYFHDQAILNNIILAGATATLVYDGTRYVVTSIDSSHVVDGLYWGQYVITPGDRATAEGCENVASGNYSHAEGYQTSATGTASHAEGLGTYASGTVGTGGGAHAEGRFTTASGDMSHAEGESCQATDSYAHAEGYGTTASNDAAHAEGRNTTASGYYSHAEGNNTTAINTNAHAEGNSTIAGGVSSHAEGQGTIASSKNQHVAGTYNVADSNNEYAYIIGNGTGNANRSNAFGVKWTGDVQAAGNVGAASMSLTTPLAPQYGGTGTTTGMGIKVDSFNSRSGVVLPQAGDYDSDLIGVHGTTINLSVKLDAIEQEIQNIPGVGILPINKGGTGNADGYIRTGQLSGTTMGNYATAEGRRTTSSGFASHAEGSGSVASGNYSHAEADGTASGASSHAEGLSTVASGWGSHAEGYGTIAAGQFQHVSGKFNVSDSNDRYAEIVGNGLTGGDRSNARTLDWDGNETVAGDLKGYATVSAIAKRKDLTINSPVSDSTYTGYSYKQAFTWNGVTADHFGDVALKSGTYTGDIAMLTAANSVTLFFSTNPSGIVVTVVVYESKLVT